MAEDDVAVSGTEQSEETTSSTQASQAPAETYSSRTVLGGIQVEKYDQRGYITDAYSGIGQQDQQSYGLEVLRPSLTNDTETINLFKVAVKGKPDYELCESDGYVFAKKLLKPGDTISLLSREEIAKALGDSSLNLEANEIEERLQGYDNGA
jgi:hypothetical protein